MSTRVHKAVVALASLAALAGMAIAGGASLNFG